MKMHKEETGFYSCEKEKNEISKVELQTDITERERTNLVFGAIDMWKMNKKHKTLGSSIRCHPL